MARRRRFARTARVLGRLCAIALIFGLVTSIIGLLLVPDARLGERPSSGIRVQEVTHLYPVTMRRVLTPITVADIASAVASTTGPISIGGGRYSMGGQTATPDGLQLDMREFRGVVAFDPKARTITV